MREYLTSFATSLGRLREVIAEEKTVKNRDAAIKRFEFTAELAWKCIQRFLRDEEIVCRSPKECMQEAFAFGLIPDDPRWIEALKDRNLTVHTYDEATADEVYDRLPRYVEIFEYLRDALKKKLEE